MKIALSKASGSPKYLRYAEWMHRVRPDLEFFDMAEIDPAKHRDILQQCSGIVFTGGADVVPERYGRAEDYHRCHVDPERDEFEFQLVHHARELKLPILGVCRGAQMLNVAFGGTLIVDIPSDRPGSLQHAAHNHHDSRHDLSVEPESLFKKICRQLEGEVNSAHHQAVDQLADVFQVSARSSDGIIEAFESTEFVGTSVILAVQWHPERLEFENPFSHSVAEFFCFECESYEALMKGRDYFKATGEEQSA